MRHIIAIRRQGRGLGRTLNLSRQIRLVLRQALQESGIENRCEVNLLYTDDEAVRTLNREHRGKDAVTDVLSFPLLPLEPGLWPKPRPEYINDDTGAVTLGDMVLCLPQAKRQAEEYGHSLEREVCFLAVHSLLHLLGYHHEEDEAVASAMRRMEEKILESVGLTRTVL